MRGRSPPALSDEEILGKVESLRFMWTQAIKLAAELDHQGVTVVVRAKVGVSAHTVRDLNPTLDISRLEKL